MATREARRRTFDEVAELYDRHRPGYPEPLVDDMVWLSGLPPRPLLERARDTGLARVADCLGAGGGAAIFGNHPERGAELDRRSALLTAIREAIEGCGGTITIDYVTRLHFARRGGA